MAEPLKNSFGVEDPEAYVRVSVANNLNDISKDNPQVVVDLARRWWPRRGSSRCVQRARVDLPVDEISSETGASNAGPRQFPGYDFSCGSGHGNDCGWSSHTVSFWSRGHIV